MSQTISKTKFSRLLYQADNSSSRDHFRIVSYTNFVFVPHLHKDLEFVLVLEGEVDYSTPYHSGKIDAGNIALFLSNQIHAFSTPHYSKCVVVNFSVEYVGAFMRRITGKIGKQSEFVADKALYNYLYALYVTLPKEKLSYLDIKASCYAVCAGYLNNIKLIDAPKDDGNILQQILSYVNDHYLENVKLESMGADIGYNKDYLSHYFRDKTGLHFREYVNLLRINHACQLIEQQNMTISRIAFECGFQNIRCFNRVFKQITGDTPTNYKPKSEKSIIDAEPFDRA